MKYLIINKVFDLNKNISNEDDMFEAAIDIGLLSGDYTILETLDNFRKACKHLDQYKSRYYKYGLYMEAGPPVCA